MGGVGWGGVGGGRGRGRGSGVGEWGGVRLGGGGELGIADKVHPLSGGFGAELVVSHLPSTRTRGSNPQTFPNHRLKVCGGPRECPHVKTKRIPGKPCMARQSQNKKGRTNTRTRAHTHATTQAKKPYPLKLQALGKLIFYRHIAHVTQKVEKLCF